MDSHPYDVLPLERGGSLIFTPCPGTRGTDVQTSVSQLKQAGAQAVITLTPAEEMARLGVEDLPDACRRQGLAWLHLPVEDDAAPASLFHERWQAQKVQAHQILDHGGALAIHCKGGSGRTGLMAAIILLERGNKLERVLSTVQALRPKALKLQAHVDYLAGIAKAADTGDKI